MSLHRTYTDAERAALKMHRLDAQGPSQLSDAFVLGMRHASWKPCSSCVTPDECRELGCADAEFTPGVTPCDEAQQEYEPVGDFIARPQPDGEPLWERAADWSAEKVTLYRKRPSGVAGMAARPTDAQIEWRMELFDLLTKWYEAPSASTAKQDAWIAICRHVPPGTTPPALASGVMGMEEPKNG